MRVALLEKEVFYFDLPFKVDGSFWMPDGSDSSNNLINIEAFNNQWVLNSSDDVNIISGNSYVDKIVLSPNNFYMLEKANKRKLLYAFDTYDNTFCQYIVSDSCSINVGSDITCGIIYNNSYAKGIIAELSFSGGVWTIKKTPETILYVNNFLITSNTVNLKIGDVVFLYGLRIVFVSKLLVINNPNNSVSIDNMVLQRLEFSKKEEVNLPEVKEKEFYEENDYFLKSPRLRRFVETREIEITPPPPKVVEDDTPLIYVLGPMLATASMSIVNFANVLTRINSNETTWAKSWPQLITCFMMITATLLWPSLSKRYKKRQTKKKEIQRQSKYREYLQLKNTEISDKMREQTSILEENLISDKECVDIILNKKRQLWERKFGQQDFLTIRVGTGTISTNIKLDYKIEEFSMIEDELKTELEAIAKKAEHLYNVPIGYSFFDKKVSAIMGSNDKVRLFVKSILAQFIAFHSYDDLKIAVFTTEEKKKNWDYLKVLPHCFSDDKQQRFFATSKDERQELGNYLSDIIKSRTVSEEGTEKNNKDSINKPCFVIFTDSVSEAIKVDAINDIIETDEDIGFVVIIIEDKISKLPSKCTNFISLGIVTSDIVENGVESNYHQEFNDELQDDFSIEQCCNVLANIPIKFDLSNRQLPNSVSFLEMYNVGKVEQLNALNRWKVNDPIKSLKAQVGVDELQEPVYLDLHEKFHGPHGLIAGMTGSGKSEFIITYILSMALNYSPNEVSFILIDYKGGGLVGAFENQKLGIKLPHLSGKITNLDKAEMNRTLVSIDSELRRRQQVFNQARDLLGESTIDIYKYQKLFREGKITEAVPHLFIISDEFAELKAQQPEFMANLISAARIGRSLGVHLILATQKPSGVVNDQIWSNSRFRVCLKVQEKADSNEMIKSPVAAELKQVGRFYLQVGYNEIFQLGQSGWCGAPYFPSNVVKKNYDRSVTFITNTGVAIASLEDSKLKKKELPQGDELTNILKYIVDTAEKEKMFSKKMWLDSIPEIIFVDDLVSKYNVPFDLSNIFAIVGEYDDPKNQLQNLLTIPFSQNGNTIIYSISSSDREMMLNSIIYSTTSRYSVDDINYYIVDYGAETLRRFLKLPHIGDMVFSGEKEKLTNLFKLIDETIEERKRKFTNFSGQYTVYCKESGERVPLVGIILNDYDALIESDPFIQDQILQYSRDCERYGVFFIITCSSINSVRSRIRQLFHNAFVLEMNSKEDYTVIVGNWKNVCLFELPGRGLVKLDEVFEFQTSTVFPEERFSEMLNAYISKVIGTSEKKAKKIPVLPDVISIEMLKENLTSLNSIPIGLAKNTLQCVTYDFTNNIGNIIASNEIENCINLTFILLKELRMVSSVNAIVLDPDKVFEKYSNQFDKYFNDDFNSVLDGIPSILEESASLNSRFLFIIVEPSRLKAKSDVNNLNKVSTIFKARDDVSVLFVVSSGKARGLELDVWYNSLVNKQCGIWIGNGIIEQGVFRTNTLMKDMKAVLDNKYAWFIKNGNNVLVKLIDTEKSDNDE